ncbi:hypothetical protein ABMA70_01950 [Halobacteriovorax sp. XZX-3]|uniref:hypothetical protein n=1 Tax=unclassified Halobacteriovorax TaxID=2639665 RepID=UPI00130480F5|nr:hypothetical protein [Halobacteriovorax sp. DA5]
MKKIISLLALSTLVLFSASCSSNSTRDVASERKDCKETSVPDYEQYYENYEDCNKL